MTWGTYYFFYECPQCGKKYRYELEGSADEEFGFCPECHVMGTFVGEIGRASCRERVSSPV